MHQEGSLQNDIKMLSEIKVIAKSGIDLHDDTSFVQESGSMNEMLNKKFAQLKLTKSEADLGASQCKQLRKQIEQIMNSGKILLLLQMTLMNADNAVLCSTDWWST